MDTACPEDLMGRNMLGDVMASFVMERCRSGGGFVYCLVLFIVDSSSSSSSCYWIVLEGESEGGRKGWRG